MNKKQRHAAANMISLDVGLLRKHGWELYDKAEHGDYREDDQERWGTFSVGIDKGDLLGGFQKVVDELDARQRSCGKGTRVVFLTRPTLMAPGRRRHHIYCDVAFLRPDGTWWKPYIGPSLAAAA